MRVRRRRRLAGGRRAPPKPGAPSPPSASAGSSNPASASGGQSSVAGSGQAATKQNVDVAAVLDGLASKNSQKLDWKHSIVDMMKLLDMDSSLTARKELAKELNYTGDTNDSAAMN